MAHIVVDVETFLPVSTLARVHENEADKIIYRIPRHVKKIGEDGKEKLDKGNYSGVYYRAPFKTDRPIILRGLEFFGPASEENGNYMVKVHIVREVPVFHRWDYFKMFAPFFVTETYLPETVAFVVHAKKGERFNAGLPIPVRLEPEIFYDIKFELIGSITQTAQSGKRGSWFRAQWEYQLPDTSRINVCFLEGSRQLTGLLIEVPEY